MIAEELELANAFMGYFTRHAVVKFGVRPAWIDWVHHLRSSDLLARYPAGRIIYVRFTPNLCYLKFCQYLRDTHFATVRRGPEST